MLQGIPLVELSAVLLGLAVWSESEAPVRKLLLLRLCVDATDIAADRLRYWSGCRTPITQPLLWAGLLANLFYPLVSMQNAVLGAVIGYTSLWLVFGVLTC